MSQKLPEVFFSFLDSLSFKPNAQGAPLVELWGATHATTASGQHSEIPALRLYQHSPTEVTITGFRQKLRHFLYDVDHVANDQIVDAILGCTVGAAQGGPERASFLELALGKVHKGEVSHFFVLPFIAGTDPIYFDGYRLGETDLPVLTSRCNRAGSDYAELYSAQLARRFCLQSPTFKHVVIDFPHFGFQSGLFKNSLGQDLVLNYFTHISRQHFEFMWAHLDRTQVLSAPFNAHLLDVKNFRDQMGQFAQRTTIYLEFSRKGGYVLPEGNGIILNQPGPNSEAFARFENHREKYRLSDVGDSELGRTLLMCAGFCQQAIRFLETGRSEDAALYSTICLEHLFSEKTSTSDVVCTRTAALTFLRLGTSYSEAERELRKLYDSRSAFVHSGKSVTPVQAERLVAYARETLRSLLSLHLNPENRSPGFLQKWVKKLDFLIKGFEAGQTFDESFLAENGINP